MINFKNIHGTRYACLRPGQAVLGYRLGKHVVIEIRPSDLPMNLLYFMNWLHTAVMTHTDEGAAIELRWES